MNHLTLACTDIDLSFPFYRDVLGFQPLVKWDKGAYFLIGDFWFCLNVDKNRLPTACYTHYAFTVPKEQFDNVCAVIIASGVEIFNKLQYVYVSPGVALEESCDILRQKTLRLLTYFLNNIYLDL